MSTERKPGSRGITERFAGGPAGDEAKFGDDRRDAQQESRKGSTKTQSPSKSFKKRRRK